MLVTILQEKPEASIMKKKNSQGIYGKTTPEEASELIEEGIEVVTVPWTHRSEN